MPANENKATQGFQITREYHGNPRSLRMEIAAIIGQAVMADATDPTKGIVASGRFEGFLTRPVVDGAPALSDIVFPGRGPLPFTMGHEAQVVLADEVEMEGEDYIVESGTGALAAVSAVGKKITPYQGKWRETQSGEVPFFVVQAVLTSLDSENSFRIRATAIR
ncbi:MAG TPA: hypothetical protein VGH19_06660 [Verrucomicrobiae bacterium]